MPRRLLCPTHRQSLPPRSGRACLLRPLAAVVLPLLVACGIAAGVERVPRGVDWPGGVITGIGQGTAKPSGNRVADRLQALRAAEVMAQRALAETIHGVRVDAATTVGGMAKNAVVSSRVEGVVRGARKIRAEVAWEGDVPVATVELQACLAEDAPGCGGAATLVRALADSLRPEPEFVPAVFYVDAAIEPGPDRPQGETDRPAGVRFDRSRPVTGLVIDLKEARFARELFPVIVTNGDGGKPATVYSAKVVRPEVVRTLGIVRYADSVAEAARIERIGDNPVIAPVSEVTRENLIVLRTDTAKTVRETTYHGNDYLGEGRVVIAGR